MPLNNKKREILMQWELQKMLNVASIVEAQ